MGRNFSSPVFAGHRVESSRQAAVVAAAAAIRGEMLCWSAGDERALEPGQKNQGLGKKSENTNDSGIYRSFGF